MLKVVSVIHVGSSPSSSGMVKPKDLPIYTESTAKNEYQQVGHEKGSLEQYISVVRTQLWKWSDKCQGAVDKTKTVYRTTEKTTKDVVEFIKTEENLAPRAAVIGLAGLTGVVLARKGGIISKLLYSSVLTTGTTSLCYPYQSVRLAKAEWQWINNKLGLDELYQQAREKIGTKSTKSTVPSQPEPEKSANKMSSNSPPAADKVDESIMDHGQSNPADKDMYSTRS